MFIRGRGVVEVPIKSVISGGKDNVDQILELSVVIERLKRLRALNKNPDKIGITQYTWRSFSIDKTKRW
ncbi:MAG: hypothetical protein JW800_06020 [Candidatus Omnitrophica bacterium]|nr:hypothetical protein [Candidatus Omnitrophota bacterium]